MRPLRARLALDTSFGKDSEQRGFSDLRQADNSCLHKRDMLAQRQNRFGEHRRIDAAKLVW